MISTNESARYGVPVCTSVLVLLRYYIRYKVLFNLIRLQILGGKTNALTKHLSSNRQLEIIRSDYPGFILHGKIKLLGIRAYLQSA